MGLKGEDVSQRWLVREKGQRIGLLEFVFLQSIHFDNTLLWRLIGVME